MNYLAKIYERYDWRSWQRISWLTLCNVGKGFRRSYRKTSTSTFSYGWEFGITIGKTFFKEEPCGFQAIYYKVLTLFLGNRFHHFLDPRWPFLREHMRALKAPGPLLIEYLWPHTQIAHPTHNIDNFMRIRTNIGIVALTEIPHIIGYCFKGLCLYY